MMENRVLFYSFKDKQEAWTVYYAIWHSPRNTKIP